MITNAEITAKQNIYTRRKTKLDKEHKKNNKTNVKCINVRLSSGYGSPVFYGNNCWWLVINDLCKTAFTKNIIKLLSDGSPQRDFIHISDIALTVKKLLLAKKEMPRVMNLCSGKTISMLEIAKIVQKNSIVINMA